MTLRLRKHARQVNLRGIRLAVVLILIGGELRATTITVNSTVDTRANDGLCSLREAIIAANTNAPSGGAAGECPAGAAASSDTITLPAGTLQLALAGSEDADDSNALVGDLDITQSLSLVGQGTAVTTISGQGVAARVLHLGGTNAQVSISNLRITGGFSSGSGGGILASDGASLSLSNVILSGNHSDQYGGGLDADIDVTISGSSVTGNTANFGGGGIAYFGDSLSIVSSSIDGNQANGGFLSQGGGIYLASSALLSLSQSSVAENQADDDGGGLYVSGSLVASTSTIRANHSDDDGGGIYFSFPHTSQLQNCTLSANSAAGQGGALRMGSGDTVTLTHVTIANNVATEGSAIDGADELALANTIVSGACSGALTSLGGNIESPGDNCGLSLPSDRTAISSSQLALGALASNGGSTLTHLPATGSIAIDSAAASRCLATDQRGVSRPQGGGCDVGAVEVQPPSPALLLQNGRFKIEATWRIASGTTGAGQPAQLTSDTGYFWFFNSANVEFVVKVLNACGVNNRYWIFAGGLTDVFVEIRVTDTARGVTKTYTNPQGHAFQPIQDTSSMATCP